MKNATLDRELTQLKERYARYLRHPCPDEVALLLEQALLVGYTAGCAELARIFRSAAEHLSPRPADGPDRH